MNINKQEIKNTIYNDIRKHIFDRTLVKGDRLVESRIAETYQVNKIHVKTALQQLELDGLISHIPMKGYVVIGINYNSMREIAKIRQILETAILERFLEEGSDEDIDEAARLTKKKIIFLENSMKEEAVTETKSFFTKLYSCSPYHRMTELLKQYDIYINEMIRTSFDRDEDRLLSIQNSKILYQALNERNIDLIHQWAEVRFNKLVKKIDYLISLSEEEA